MELVFYTMMYSKPGNENSDVGHVKCSRVPQVHHPCHNLSPRGEITKDWRIELAALKCYVTNNKTSAPVERLF